MKVDEAKDLRDGREKRDKWKTNGKKNQCMGNMLATRQEWTGRKHGIGYGRGSSRDVQKL